MKKLMWLMTVMVVLAGFSAGAEAKKVISILERSVDEINANPQNFKKFFPKFLIWKNA